MMTVDERERTAIERARASPDRSSQICAAPSCWETGSRIEIAGDDVETAPVLCETHRQAYLGVPS